MGNTQGAHVDKLGVVGGLRGESGGDGVVSLSPTHRSDQMDVFDFSDASKKKGLVGPDHEDGQLVLQMTPGATTPSSSLGSPQPVVVGAGSGNSNTAAAASADLGPMRPRASTISPGATLHKSALPTVFRWEGGGGKVYVSGSFDKWAKKFPLIKSHGDFSTIIELPEGEHQYKFFVDGEWQVDPHLPTCTSPAGTVNNVINVKKTDFEVFEALAMDSMVTSNHNNNNGSGGAESAPARAHHFSGGHSPPGSYSQEVPSRKPAERHAGPPMLPPHLLEVILNKDTNVRCDPALLPEPPSVMLNHLYALSIKDGVMVLSATHRHKKKYVTTLLYKPI